MIIEPSNNELSFQKPEQKRFACGFKWRAKWSISDRWHQHTGKLSARWHQHITAALTLETLWCEWSGYAFQRWLTGKMAVLVQTVPLPTCRLCQICQKMKRNNYWRLCSEQRYQIAVFSKDLPTTVTQGPRARGPRYKIAYMSCFCQVTILTARVAALPRRCRWPRWWWHDVFYCFTYLKFCFIFFSSRIFGVNDFY